MTSPETSSEQDNETFVFPLANFLDDVPISITKPTAVTAFVNESVRDQQALKYKDQNIERVIASQVAEAKNKKKTRYKPEKHSLATTTVSSGKKIKTCPHCPYTSLLSSNVFRHIESRHTETKDKQHECPTCKKRFCTFYSLQQHITGQHEGGFICQCHGKKFMSKSGLNIHLRVYDESKQHKCPHCDRLFKTKQHYEEHLNIHSEMKPYICEKCGKGFAWSSSLRNHLPKCKPAPDLARIIHRCEVCDTEYSSKRYLISHQKTKHSANPRCYMCSLCGQTFSWRQCRDRHEKEQRCKFNKPQKTGKSRKRKETAGYMEIKPI